MLISPFKLLFFPPDFFSFSVDTGVESVTHIFKHHFIFLIHHLYLPESLVLEKSIGK